MLDDLGHVAQRSTVAARDDLHLLDVEAELVQPLEALLGSRVTLADADLTSAVSSCPQRLVAVLDRQATSDRVDAGSEAATRLQVEQTAGDVLGGDRQVELALAGGELG